LQGDVGLTEILKEVRLKAGEITVDLQENQIRIYCKWVHEENLPYSPAMLEIADRIAFHIKTRLPDRG
jgi:hypothetical protein